MFYDEQVLDEEFEVEVNNVIEEFKWYDQEYDEVCVWEQVIVFLC